MAEQMKFIVSELNKEPFTKSLNLISFDSMTEDELVQLLSDVITTIEQKPIVTIKNEPADETAVRLFNALRIMRYRSPTDQEELSQFRAGVIAGDKHTIHPILEWILQRTDELTQRMYLAKFLVQVDVPPDYQQDPELQALQEECDALMEQFKVVHQEASSMKQDVNAVDDIRQDLQTMEQEREQLTRRIEKATRKVDTVPQRDEMLSLATQLRKAAEHEQALVGQKQEQRNALMHADQKIARLQQQLRDLRQQAESMKPQDMISKLQDENSIHAYLLNEKLPKEIEAKRKAVQHMSKVLAQPAMDNKDIDELNQKIADTNNELVRLAEEHDAAVSSGDEKLSIYRHQATMVERKKETAAERLQDTRRELAAAETDVQQKKAQMRDPEGNEIVTSVQFKNYVTKLRSKTNGYKKKRAELQDLRAEFGVLARTEEILKTRMEELKSEMESNGQTFVTDVEDPLAAQLARPKTAKPHTDDIKQLKTMVADIEGQVEHRRNALMPVLQELKPLREQYQELADEYQRAKQQYNTTAASLESGFAQLEQEVKSMRADLNQSESVCTRLSVEQQLLEWHLKRAQNETAASADASFRHQLESRISNADQLGSQLRTEQNTQQGDHQEALKQMKMWRDLVRLLEAKQKHLLDVHADLIGNRNPSATSKGSNN